MPYAAWCILDNEKKVYDAIDRKSSWINPKQTEDRNQVQYRKTYSDITVKHYITSMGLSSPEYSGFKWEGKRDNDKEQEVQDATTIKIGILYCRLRYGFYSWTWTLSYFWLSEE